MGLLHLGSGRCKRIAKPACYGEDGVRYVGECGEAVSEDLRSDGI